MNSSAIRRKDWLEFVRDRAFVAAVLVAAVLGLAAISMSYSYVAAYERDRIAAESQDRNTWLTQGRRNPHSAAHFSSWAMRPLTPLALLDPGAAPYAGNAIWMEAHNQNPARHRPVNDNASVLDLGQFSVAWVLQHPIPLIVLMIGASLIARERERGTLRAMMANGVTPQLLVRAKFWGLARMGVVPVGLIALAGLFVAAATPAVAPGDILLRVLLWLATYIALLAIVMAIAIAVSAVSSTVARALTVSVAFWLLSFFLVPRMAAGLADAVAPAPTPEVFAADMARDLAEIAAGHGEADKAFTKSVLDRYGVSREEDLPVSLAGLQLEESERQGNVVFDKHFARLYDIYERQRGISRMAGLLSPLFSAQNISTALAGTDLMHQTEFQRQAEAHRRLVVTQLNTDMIERGRGKDFDYLADPSLWAAVPRFEHRAPRLGDVLQAVWIDVLALAAWLAGSAIALLAASRRLSRGDT